MTLNSSPGSALQRNAALIRIRIKKASAQLDLQSEEQPVIAVFGEALYLAKMYLVEQVRLPRKCFRNAPLSASLPPP